MEVNIDKLRELAKPVSEKAKNAARYRDDNRDWLNKSAKIAIRLRKILRDNNISQIELANRMGVTPVQVNKILSGKENLGLKTICKVEKAIGLSLIEIFPVKDNPFRTVVSVKIENVGINSEKVYRSPKISSKMGIMDFSTTSSFYC